jgi:hypothetical protein
MWSFITNVMLYPALALLLLVLIPKPEFIKPIVTKIVDGAFSVKFQNIPIWKCFWVASTMALANQTWCLRKYTTQSITEQYVTVTNYHDLVQRSTRWRCERNFWISMCTTLIYWNLYSHRKLMERCQVVHVNTKTR